MKSHALSALGQRTEAPPISWLMASALGRPQLISLAAGFTDHGTLPVEETRALVALIAQTGAERLVAVHATYRMVNWDGRGEQLAREMAERCGYPAERDMGYPCPGSFGTKYGVELGLEVITLESPYLVAEEAGWLECRSALRWCVDLPE